MFAVGIAAVSAVRYLEMLNRAAIIAGRGPMEWKMDRYIAWPCLPKQQLPEAQRCIVFYSLPRRYTYIYVYDAYGQQNYAAVAEVNEMLLIGNKSIERRGPQTYATNRKGKK